jgi:predicted nucleic acid-binding protein
MTSKLHAADCFTVVVDANVLAQSLPRDLVLTLFECGAVRCRWSAVVLDEMERTVARRAAERCGYVDAEQRAKLLRQKIETVFADALVENEEPLRAALPALPDPDDAHVIAAGIACCAQVIVTDNLKHFPADVLDHYNMVVETPDSFIASTLKLYAPQVMAAVREMRIARWRGPEPWTATYLIDEMARRGLVETATVLRPYVELI